MNNHYSEDQRRVIAPSSVQIELQFAASDVEKRNVFQFRYHTYVVEMAKQIPAADHESEQLCDDLDAWGDILYATVEGAIIGTIRINTGSIDDFPPSLRKILALHAFQDHPCQDGTPRFSYCSKLMVAPAYRSSSAFYLLVSKGYELFCTNQVQFAFTACNFHLFRLYEQMGFHRYADNFTDPGYGLLAPMVLPVNDLDYMRARRSPLFRIARKRGNVEQQSVQWFHATVDDRAPIVNSQLITPDELWSLICSHFTASPMESIPLLRTLSEAEAKLFFHACASLVRCHAGEELTRQGDVSYCYYLLLSGKLKSLTFIRPPKEYAIPGHFFGANGLLGHAKHTEDIVAATDCKILSLSGMAFQKFCHAQPDIADKLFQQNITLGWK